MRHGFRIVSKEEADARKKFVFSRDIFKPGKAPKPKPLSSYQNKEGTRTLADLVWARHQEEINRLDNEYRSLFRWPQCPEMQRYAQNKESLEKDYQSQQHWVTMYRNNERDIYQASVRAAQHSTVSAVMAAAGTLMVLSGKPSLQIASGFLYFGSVLQAFCIGNNRRLQKDLAESNREIRIILEDWHEPDPLARYDRSKLNRQLTCLNKEKPTEERRFKKRNLVAEYRKKHPRVRE